MPVPQKDRYRQMTFFFLIRTREYTLDRWNIQRGRHIVDDCIEHHLYALILIGGSAEHRNHFSCNRGFTDRSFDILFRQIVFLEIFHHEFLIGLRDGFQQSAAPFIGRFLHILRNAGFRSSL